MRIGIYARVSTKDQSCELQVRDCAQTKLSYLRGSPQESGSNLGPISWSHNYCQTKSHTHLNRIAPKKRTYRPTCRFPHDGGASGRGRTGSCGEPYSSALIPSVRIRRYKWLRSSPSASAVRVMCHWFSSSLRRINSLSYALRASCSVAFGC